MKKAPAKKLKADVQGMVEIAKREVPAPGAKDSERVQEYWSSQMGLR